MSLTDPTNCWTYAEKRFGDAVANSAAFQSMTGTSNETDAQKHIYGDSLEHSFDGQPYSDDERKELLKHIAQVYSSPDQPYGKRRGRSSRMEAFGNAHVVIERYVAEVDIQSANPKRSIDWEFKQLAGNLVDQVVAWLEENGGPFVRAITVVSGPGWEPREEHNNDGNYQGIIYQVEWGLEQ